MTRVGSQRHRKKQIKELSSKQLTVKEILEFLEWRRLAQ